MQENDIIFYDGYCPLCNRIISFTLKKDKSRLFKFAALNSDLARSIIPKDKLKESGIDSVILISGNNLYIKSKAVFKILSKLKTSWKVMMIFSVFPPFINDKIYDLLAGSRYRIFGRYDKCPLPPQEYKHRFISS